MPTGLYTRRELDSESGIYKPGQNKTITKLGHVIFSANRPQCKVESFYATGTQKKIDAYNVVGFCGHCSTVFEAMGCYYHLCPYQEARPSLTEEEIQRGIKKRELDELRKQYIQEKGYDFIEMYECDWWKMHKTYTIDKEHPRESFPYKMPLREE